MLAALNLDPKSVLTNKKTGLTVHGPRGLGEYHQQYKPGDLQTLQRQEDMVHETIAALESNLRVIRSLNKFYAGLKNNKDFPLRHDGTEYIDTFTDQLEDFLSDIEHLVQRASTLLKITNGQKELVSTPNISINICLTVT